MVVMTQIGVVTALCLWEIWAFDNSVISRDQKVIVSWMYGPYALIPGVIVWDMFLRVNRRVKLVEEAKKVD